MCMPRHILRLVAADTGTPDLPKLAAQLPDSLGAGRTLKRRCEGCQSRWTCRQQRCLQCLVQPREREHAEGEEHCPEKGFPGGSRRAQSNLKSQYRGPRMEAEYRQWKVRSPMPKMHIRYALVGWTCPVAAISPRGQTRWLAALYDHAGAAFLQTIASSTSLLLPLSRHPPQPLRSRPMRLSLRLPGYFARLRLPASLPFARFPEWCWPA